MVIRHVQQAPLLVMAVGADEVVVGLVRHIGGGHRNIAVTGDIDPGGVVHLVVGAAGDGEGTNIALAVIVDGGHIRWEDALVGIAPFNRRVGPPEEVARRVVAVEHLAGDFDERLVGIEGKARHYLQTAHRLHLAQPDGLGAALMLRDGEIHRHEGGGSVVLRPVELDAAGDPGAYQPHQCRLDHFVVIDEITIHHLVVGTVDATAQLRQQHHLDEVVLQPDCPIGLHLLLAGEGIDHPIGIDGPRGALIDPLLEKHGVGIFGAHLVGRQGDGFDPDLDISSHQSRLT